MSLQKFDSLNWHRRMHSGFHEERDFFLCYNELLLIMLVYSGGYVIIMGLLIMHSGFHFEQIVVRKQKRGVGEVFFFFPLIVFLWLSKVHEARDLLFFRMDKRKSKEKGVGLAAVFDFPCSLGKNKGKV